MVIYFFYLFCFSTDLIINENSASENQDFAVDTLVAYFGDGDEEAHVRINILDSPDIEPLESFTAVLDSVEGGNAVTGSRTLTTIRIVDHSGKFHAAQRERERE